MKRLLILGAGRAGTTMANRLRRKMSAKEWQITIVDQEQTYYYQPGFLFLPFGIYSAADVTRPKRQFLPNAVESIEAEIDRVDPEQNRVLLGTGDSLGYDLLIIATPGSNAIVNLVIGYFRLHPHRSGSQTFHRVGSVAGNDSFFRS